MQAQPMRTAIRPPGAAMNNFADRRTASFDWTRAGIARHALRIEVVMSERAKAFRRGAFGQRPYGRVPGRLVHDLSCSHAKPIGRLLRASDPISSSETDDFMTSFCAGSSSPCELPKSDTAGAPTELPPKGHFKC